MASSEWALCLRVEHFENLYNAEIRNDKYCCCDVYNLFVPCVEVFTDLNVTDCTSECEPYFELGFEVCFANGTCSNMKNEAAVIDTVHATCISSFLDHLHSEEFMIDKITNVSAKTTILICLCLFRIHLLIRQHSMWIHGIVKQTNVQKLFI